MLISINKAKSTELRGMYNSNSKNRELLKSGYPKNIGGFNSVFELQFYVTQSEISFMNVPRCGKII